MPCFAAGVAQASNALRARLMLQLSKEEAEGFVDELVAKSFGSYYTRLYVDGFLPYLSYQLTNNLMTVTIPSNTARRASIEGLRQIRCGVYKAMTCIQRREWVVLHFWVAVRTG